MSNQSERSEQRAIEQEKWLMEMSDEEFKHTVLAMTYILFGQRGLKVIDAELIKENRNGKKD